MADNYLGKKMEEYMARRDAGSAPRRTHSLARLLAKNRSHRAYDPTFIVREDQLRRIIEVNTRTPSARNQQVLRFRAVLADEAAKVLPHVRMGGALPELHLPTAGTEPNSYIVICSTVPETREVSIDLGISAQSMLLQATEIGLNGLCIAAFNREALREALALPYEPLLVVAIGRGADRIELVEIAPDDDHRYYRSEGTHYVPKVALDELIIK